MASLFIGFLFESKSEIRFRMVSFSSCLMRKRVAKSEAILALLDRSFRSCISSGKPK